MLIHQKIVTGYILAINSLAYAVMCFDKFQSKRKGQRILESRLFIMAFLLGSVGIYLGMKAPLYHKAAKPRFTWGIPLIMILNVACGYVIYRYV